MKNAAFFIFLFAGYLAFGQTTLYVNHTATGQNNGTSWADAFTDLQPALEAATAGDEIWVAQGTYYPSKDTGNVVPIDPRRAHFSPVDSVGIYGGFSGTETQRNQRDWRQNATTLSGDIGIKGDSLDNVHHVVYSLEANLSGETILDGFSITKGINWSDPYPPNFSGGGGILIVGPRELQLKNLRVFHNYTYFGGGGLAFRDFNSSVLNGAYVNIVNCEIFDNKCSRGGGIYLNSSKARIYQSLIYNNINVSTSSSPTYGGGLYASVYSYVEIHNTTIANNIADVGAGLRSIASKEFKVYNSIINDAFAINNVSSDQPEFQNCILKGSGGSANWASALGAVDLGGNLDVDPMFRAPNDYRLQYISAARDAGDTSLLPYDSLDLDGDGILNEHLPFDLDGRTRVLNGQVDMGAYEYFPAWADTLNASICPGAQTSFNGQIIDSAGTYSRLVASTPSGDSVQYFVLSIDTVDTRIRLGLFGGEFISEQDSASYQWIDCSSNSLLPGDTLKTFTPVQNGSYAVIVTNGTGCTDTSVCYSINNVSLEESMAGKTFSFYPNPVEDLLVLESLENISAPFTVEIHNLAGQEVFRQRVKERNASTSTLHLQDFPPGLYTLKVKGQVFKFVKR